MHGYDRIEINGETVYEAKEFNPWFELGHCFCETVRSGDGSALLNDYHDGLFTLAPVMAGRQSGKNDEEPINVTSFMHG